jgi:probable F420-dependent oxidoreductase
MSVAVGLGLAEFPFKDARGYWRWVDMCEAGGVDSLWQTDRIVSRDPFLECLIAIAAIAGRTRRLKFGVNVISLALRDPILVAKQCATIDVISEGRLLPAFGIGSPHGPEWKTLNLDTTTRGRRTDEALEIISRLWREEEVDYKGRHYHLTGASISPRPAQPDLPIWIGGSSEAAVRRTARYGTGWQGGSEPPAEAGRVVAAIRKAVAEAGRSIDDDHYGASFPTYFGQWNDPILQRAKDTYIRRTGRDPADYLAVGDADAILERIGAYVAAGVSKFVLRPVGADDEQMLAQTRQIIEQVLPRVAASWPKHAPTAAGSAA